MLDPSTTKLGCMLLLIGMEGERISVYVVVNDRNEHLHILHQDSHHQPISIKHARFRPAQPYHWFGSTKLHDISICAVLTLFLSLSLLSAQCGFTLPLEGDEVVTLFKTWTTTSEG
jgi:hypothetical protein